MCRNTQARPGTCVSFCKPSITFGRNRKKILFEIQNERFRDISEETHNSRDYVMSIFVKFGRCVYNYIYTICIFIPSDVRILINLLYHYNAASRFTLQVINYTKQRYTCKDKHYTKPRKKSGIPYVNNLNIASFFENFDNIVRTYLGCLPMQKETVSTNKAGNKWTKYIKKRWTILYLLFRKL